MKQGLYIHVPFCEQRCYYCAFTVAVAPEAAFRPYFDRLLREIDLSDYPRRPDTVYLGGGTPSLVPAEMLVPIMERVSGSPREVTIEANPGTLSAEKLGVYKEIGITRVSLGAQSLEDEDLNRAGRIHHASSVLEDYELLRCHGFTNVNLDLIAGLPQQKMQTWIHNLVRVLDLRPEHISIYMLDQEERSAWGRGVPGIPEDTDFAEFYSEAEGRLQAHGYRHYEISNWALPGFESLHNLGYWNGVPYRGFGVGAHSYDRDRRFWNTSSLAEYAARIDRGELPSLGEEILSPSMRLEEAFMLGLRQEAGLDTDLVARNLDVRYPKEWFDRVVQLQEAGWIDCDGSRIRLTAQGRLAANSVIGELLWPTPSSTFEATR